MAFVGRAHLSDLAIIQILPGQYYYTDMVNAGSSTTTVTAGRLYYQRLPYFGGQVIDRMAIEVTTGAAGAARLGLYLDTGAGRPGALLLDAGTVDTTSIATVEASFTAITLPFGMLWAAAIFSATPTCRSGTVNNTGRNGSSTFGTGHRGWLATQAYGTLPSTAVAFNSDDGAANIPMIAIKKS